MTRRAIDLNGVRRELRSLPRGDSLRIAERAAELISNVKLTALLGDVMQLNEIEAPSSISMSPINEVRLFHNREPGR